MVIKAWVALLLVVPAGAFGGDAGTGEAWRSKADGALLAALEAADEVRLVVQGQPLPEPLTAPASRDAWRAYWAAESAPWLDQLRAQAEALHGRVTLEVPAVNAAFVALPSKAVPALLMRPDVRRAGLDAPDAVAPLPLDGGPSPALAVEDAVAHLQAQELWALGYQGEGIRVGIIDTGIRPTHDVARNADGGSRIVAWYDATGPSGHCSDPCDTNGHGTSSTHAAAGGNAFNASVSRGAAPRADLVGVRVFQAGGGTWEDAQEGLQAAFDLGVHVAAAPWGGACAGAANVTADLAETLADAGMVLVFPGGAGGPSAGTVMCPARADRVLGTGYTDADEVVMTSSSRGPCTWEGVTRVCPDLVAVSQNLVLATDDCDTCYVTTSGGSWASAQDAGLVALLHQVSVVVQGRPLDQPMEAEVLLTFTARDLGAAGPDNDYGWGMPQGRAAHDLLVGEPVFYLRDSLSVERPVLRAYQTSRLAFVLTSLGIAPLEGRVVVVARQLDTGACPPTCEVVVVADQDQALHRFSQASFSHLFDGAAHAAGTWRLDATYDYCYASPGGEVCGSVARSAEFVLRKVELVAERAVPLTATTGTPVLGQLLLRNVGNEKASNLSVLEQFTWTGHVPLPVVPPGEGFFGAFANPAPDAVALDPSGDARYTWTGREAPAGEAWSADYNVVAANPGDYAFVARVAYEDELGRPFTETFAQPARVTLW